ncbi:MAG: DUF4013 domain-containing protein [Dehalococcoidia bacterium]|nr:DUF4013 domain-containing protein [Dehalococcoidia bacterium]
MEIGKAFSYVFDDEKWINKVLIGALFALLGSLVVGWFFVLGYVLEVMQNVSEGKERPLPEWDNLGDKLSKGFMFFVVILIYMLPILVISICASVGGGMAGSGNNAAATIGGIISAIVSCLGFIYYIVLTVAIPAIMIRYAATRSVSACLQFGQIISFITGNMSNYIIVVLLSVVAYIIAGIGTIACFIGVFATSFYALMIIAHLLGQLTRITGTAAGSGEVTPA